MNGPAWPEAQPWENYQFAALAVAVVVLNREQILARDAVVEKVLMPQPQRRMAEFPIDGAPAT
jgi:hypothetical protein